MVIGFVFMLAPWVLEAVWGGVMGLGTAWSGGRHGGVFLFVGLSTMVFSLLIIAAAFFATLFSWVGSMRMSIYGRLAAGFQFGKIWAMIRHDFGGLLRILGMALLLAIAIGIVASVLIFVLVFIGLFVGFAMTGGNLNIQSAHPGAAVWAIVFATGGIGGVHRGAEKTMDFSADLQELRQTSVAVVCAGAKMILDIGLTLEYLETMGVPVLGLRTDDFPAFYCRRSGFGVDHNAKDEAEIARIAKTKWDLGLAGGILIGNPVPEEYAMDFDEMTAVIEKAIAGANAEGVRGKNITPYLLAHIVEYTGGQSLKTNIQLAYNNARAAGKIAVAYARL